MRARRPRTQVVRGHAPFQRTRNMPERLWVAPAGMCSVSPLRKGYFTAETQRSQRRVPYCVTQTHAARCIHHGSFLGSLRLRRLSGAFVQRRHPIRRIDIMGKRMRPGTCLSPSTTEHVPGRNRVVPGRLESPATPGNRADGDRRQERAGDATPPPRSGARARGSSPAPARPLQACGAARPPDRSADQ